MKCEICGVELPEGTYASRRFCIPCAYERRLQKQRERQRAARGKKKTEKPKPEPPKARTLSEIAREAAEHGMSYGQWVIKNA